MRIKLYFDEDAMDSDVVRALRLRGIEVTTANDVGLIGSPDEEHLAHATATLCVLYSFNVSDFMALHSSYLAAGKDHAGIVLAQPQLLGTDWEAICKDLMSIGLIRRTIIRTTGIETYQFPFVCKGGLGLTRGRA